MSCCQRNGQGQSAAPQVASAVERQSPYHVITIGPALREMIRYSQRSLTYIIYPLISKGLSPRKFNLIPHIICREDFESSSVSPKSKTDMGTRRTYRRPLSGLHITLNSKTFLTVLHRYPAMPRLHFQLGMEQSMGPTPTMPLHTPRVRTEHRMGRSFQAETRHCHRPWRWIATLPEA